MAVNRAYKLFDPVIPSKGKPLFQGANPSKLEPNVRGFLGVLSVNTDGSSLNKWFKDKVEFSSKCNFVKVVLLKL